MAQINSVTDLTCDGGIAIITIDSPPVNALSAAVRKGLAEAFTQAVADTAATAIVLICAGRTFIAGADITELDGGGEVATLEDIQATMEESPKPVVAAIHGTALGGGLEVALCAHYRIAVPSAKCGLPEVKLGLLPGGGGTQRLPRLVGAEKALEMVVTGRHVAADECLATGLIDALAPEGELEQAAVAFARALVAEGKPLRRVRDRQDEMLHARAHPEIFTEFRKANADLFRGFVAPEANLKCIEAAVNLSFGAGLAVEHELFMGLLNGAQSAAQRYAFFAERQAVKMPDVPDSTPATAIRKAGVVGAGALAAQIAADFARAGIPMAIVQTQGVPENLGGAFAELADCDLVVEALTDAPDSTAQLLMRLAGIVRPDAVLATTSRDNADAIARATPSPERVIGLQFATNSDARLLEIVRSASASPQTLATARKLAKALGKVAVITHAGATPVGIRMRKRLAREIDRLAGEGVAQSQIGEALHDFGFAIAPAARATGRDSADTEILERCIYAVVNEAADILEEGLVIRASDIDVLWISGHGWPAYDGGPMYHADNIGLPRVLAKIAQLHARLGDDWKPAVLIERLVSQGSKISDIQ